MRNSFLRTVRAAVIALLAASFLLPPGGAPTVQAQEPQNVVAPALAVNAAPGETQVRWQAAPSALEAAATTTQLPLQPYGAYLLPMQTFAVRSDGDFVSAATATRLVDVAWTGQLPPAPKLSPPALDWEPVPWLQRAAPTPLPNAPLFVLRTGRLRGAQITVYAFSEIYQDASGALRRVVEFDAAIPGSQPVDELSAFVSSGEPDAIESQAAPALAGAASPPTNSLAGRRAVKVFVAQAGIQRITADVDHRLAHTVERHAARRRQADGVAAPLGGLLDVHHHLAGAVVRDVKADDAKRARATRRQTARGAVGRIVQLADGGQNTPPRVFRDVGVIVDDARNSLRGNSRQQRHVA